MLSQETALTCLMELHAELLAFLMDHNAELSKVLNDNNCVHAVEYMPNMLSKMNLTLQGKTVTV